MSRIVGCNVYLHIFAMKRLTHKMAYFEIDIPNVMWGLARRTI
jgi:hypothetical protein